MNGSPSFVAIAATSWPNERRARLGVAHLGSHAGYEFIEAACVTLVSPDQCLEGFAVLLAEDRPLWNGIDSRGHRQEIGDQQGIGRIDTSICVQVGDCGPRRLEIALEVFARPAVG